ncbi:histidine kinase [Sediminicola sp. YIK13]|uniref:sensor histidine kinase n=1 Tax=Sediminicola sp. YIK13 TaxID=1453352 RepID=UPI000720EC90|nr:sensor histidine kinase [Sediminicola sp. YIK13]ALM07554.1 histidine kinase [Sediminicola sp. YIK13]
MKKPPKDYNRLMDKIKLTHRVNYLSSALMLIFYPIALFLLDIGQPIPYIFLAFGLLNIINTLLFKFHNNLILTYNITSGLATIGTVLITLYSGGINSPFIFVLGIIVFAAYATTRKYGKVYLYLNLLIIILIYVLSSSNYAITENVVPLANRSLFALFCVLFSVYMIGGVFGKFLLKAHHRLYKSKREIEDRISEKETLLREVHHRVKNNLQTVSSLLSLQSRSIEDKKIKSLIKSSQNRVISMAMVHEMLYMRDDYLSKIEYKNYVNELSQYLVRSVKGNKNNVKLNIDIADIKLGIDTAIPLGLLINEAITNALKYGIKDDMEGIIHIELKQENEKEFVLNIGDNGEGFSDSITPQTSKSLGLKLIHNLARQLKGSITKDLSLKGTNYIIRFQEVTQEFNSVA